MGPDVLEQHLAIYQNMPESFNKILSGISDIEEADAYTSVVGHGAAGLESLQDVINVMQALEGVKLPDPMRVEHMSLEGDDRGGPFDARVLSQIL